MALTSLELTTILKGAAAAKQLLEQLKPALDALNTIYNAGTVGLTNTITQGNLDATTSLSGITKTQLDDAMYALTTTVKGDLVTVYNQLEFLAARATAPLSSF